MLCQQCGLCCVTMDVIILAQKDQELRACIKPGDQVCPHLVVAGEKTRCAVHELPEYKSSSCWRYGNSDVDPDFIHKRGRPCQVGELIRNNGGIQGRAATQLESRPTLDDLEDFGPWKEEEDSGL